MITEETLTLYYFDDGLSPDERRQVARALADNRDLAADYEALKKDLDGWRNPSVEPMPAFLQQQMHDTVARAARLEKQAEPARKPSLHVLSFVWGAAVTAALVLGVGVTVYLGGGQDPVLVVPTVQSTPGATTAAFTRGLQAHLQDSQFELASLASPGGGSDNGDRTALVMQIVNQNRMFERAAVQNDAQNVARVLRAFEPILLRLASEDIAPADAEALRAQLTFELNVMLTKLARQTSEEPQSI